MSPSPKKSSKKDEKAPADVAAEQVVSDDEEEEQQEEQVGSKAGESSAMQKLNDHVEEKQLDEGKMKEAFLALHKQEEADKEAERKREKLLAAVKVNKADVELVAREMELTVQQADRKLREADGDVVKCLKALIA
ncbi:TPA: hypothetical protein N0F65_011866 [Lagenidium giganteum]|uniref:Nascent polypeptide-associated complex subunit alpha-like UBA domain-containing protein n=1 Tax=Lagenidium giganteum TaxID=4803 RepID=A0AAV2YMI2_9STRA|nr:TPA: hypothetical protein N0F65_011866 [Lagenidium giganteum]